ncbi:MOSC domain-containing protein [Kushneria aurantia]|uniref:MOSC domain-containing protein n=1 Tax=Kushneria aurantia TaxID=504092 RepID=A0ABV6G3T7_9GAMM|nr:MOSC N-terminal beta barrel domain-containing protein [Kushneria aurantia]
MTSSASISALYIYPVKSLAGIDMPAVMLTGEGLAFDRRWVITDERGNFVTQRDCPAMATLGTAIDSEHLIITAPSRRHLFVPLAEPATPADRVRIFKTECQGQDEGDEAAAWLSAALGRSVRLKRVPRDNRRRVSPQRLGELVALTGFADGYPLLVTASASLAALNARLAERELPPVPMSRFRPNLVIDHTPAFAEHAATRLGGEGFSLWLCKPCERCRVVTVDQCSGEILHPGEPLGTLSRMSHVEQKGAFFGENAVVLSGEGVTLARAMRVVLSPEHEGTAL